jgi:glycosyltransferase involved in cell wall biosynthesis
MRRVLIVAYYFPPLGGAGALRVLGFAQHLPEFGWEPVVLAPSNGAYLRDPSLSFPAGQTVRTRSLELSRAGKRALAAGGDDVQPAMVGPLRSLSRRLARRWLYFPDAQVGWYPGAAAAGRRLAREGTFDAIFSSSFPITAHLVARAVHRRVEIPWIAEFRDPWSVRMSGAPALQQRRAQRLERAIADEASAVVMTSPTWAAAYSERWGRSVTAIPNGVGRTPPPPPTDHELVVCFLGTYYPGRQDLTAVWRALARIAADPASPPVCLHVVGEASPAMRAEVRAAGIESLVEVTGFLAHEEALRRVAAASLLLAAGPSRSGGVLGEGWVPAKLFEYLATGLPVLWVGALPNDGASLLTSYPGCRILEPDRVKGVVAAIREEAGKRYARDLRGLARRDRTQALAELLDAQVQSRAGEASSASPKIEIP